MGGFSQIPQPPVQYDVDLFWPTVTVRRALGGAFELGGMARYGGAALAGLWSAPAGPGAVENMGRDANGVPVGQLVSNGAGGVTSNAIDGFMIDAALQPAGYVAGFKLPSWQRLYRLQVYLRIQAASLSAAPNTFFGFAPSGAGGVGTPDGGQPFFGLTLDGAGNWQFATRDVIAGLLVANPLGLVATAPALFDFVVTAATPIGPATFQLFVNANYAAPAIALDWAVGTRLPTYAAVVAGMQFAPIAGARDPAVATVLQVGYLRCMAGAFTPSGVQL
jgi:hypothetical protein